MNKDELSVLERLRKGHTISRIMNELNISRSYISKVKFKYSDELSASKPLISEQEILNRLKSGDTIKDISEDLNIAKSLISNIKYKYKDEIEQYLKCHPKVTVVDELKEHGFDFIGMKTGEYGYYVCKCSNCGKSLEVAHIVKDKKTGIVYYLGSECFKKINTGLYSAMDDAKKHINREYDKYDKDLLFNTLIKKYTLTYEQRKELKEFIDKYDFKS